MRFSCLRLILQVASKCSYNFLAVRLIPQSRQDRPETSEQKAVQLCLWLIGSKDSKVDHRKLVLARHHDLDCDYIINNRAQICTKGSLSFRRGYCATESE